MSLRLLYRVFLQFMNLLVLLGRSSASKDVELLVLRHEVTVLRKANPKPRLDWADLAVFAALVRTVPKVWRVHRVITPDTILRWHRRLVATTWTCPNRVGRRPVDGAVAVLIERMAREYQSWGYQRNNQIRRRAHGARWKGISRLARPGAVALHDYQA